MKRKLSITLEQETFEQIEDLAKQSSFRNRSHVVEFAVKMLAEKGKEERKGGEE